MRRARQSVNWLAVLDHLAREEDELEMQLATIRCQKACVQELVGNLTVAEKRFQRNEWMRGERREGRKWCVIIRTLRHHPEWPQFTSAAAAQKTLARHCKRIDM